ncbi:MAG: hypothetical protein R3B40_24525 [Polyangiales bacterium]
MTTSRLFTKLSGAALMLALAAPSLALAQPSASGRGASARDAAPRATTTRVTTTRVTRTEAAPSPTRPAVVHARVATTPMNARGRVAPPHVAPPRATPAPVVHARPAPVVHARPAPVVHARPAPATPVRVVHTSAPRVVPVAQRPTQPMRVNAGLNLTVAQRARLDALRQQRQARAAHIRATSTGAVRDARLEALNAQSRAQFLTVLTPAQRHQLEVNRAARGTDAHPHRGRTHSRGK